MLSEIKMELLKDSESIVQLLEAFDFAHIHVRSSEIRFARNEDGGQNICIKLQNNEYLNVKDYVRGERLDIFSYIIKEKDVEFVEVLRKTKAILGLSEYWEPRKRVSLFGGIYDKIIKPNTDIILKTYDEKILSDYAVVPNLRFLRDGISVESQKFWGIRFSFPENRIVIPIENEWGELVGVKSRYNGDPTEDIPKYIYPVPVLSSQLLYGYSKNYEYLYGADEIYIGEAEKFVMQCYTMGIRNCVGLGSHSLSEKQARLLIQLQPKKIIFMLDKGLDLKETIKNVDIFRQVSGMFSIEIAFFDHRECELIGDKDSPSDHGLNIWNSIVSNYVFDISILEEEKYEEKNKDIT